MNFLQCFVVFTMISVGVLVASNEGKPSSVKRPVIYNNSTTKTLIVKEGQKVKLECFAGGDPAPMVSWRRHRQTFNENILNILAAKKKDQGIYTCIAENNFGESVQRRISIKVESVPTITVPCTDVVQALQYEVNLECIIDGFPIPFVIWMKDGVQIADDDTLYRITQSTAASGLTYSMLKITLLENYQFGKYICQAYNHLGSSQAPVFLNKPKRV